MKFLYFNQIVKNISPLLFCLGWYKDPWWDGWTRGEDAGEHLQLCSTQTQEHHPRRGNQPALKGLFILSTGNFYFKSWMYDLQRDPLKSLSQQKCLGWSCFLSNKIERSLLRLTCGFMVQRLERELNRIYIFKLEKIKIFSSLLI